MTIKSAALICLGASSASAAPMPGTASSKLVSPQIGLFRSPDGFQVNAGDSGWIHLAAPQGNKYIATVYRAPDSQTGEKDKTAKKSTPASLTIRVDDLPKELPLDKYV